MLLLDHTMSDRPPTSLPGKKRRRRTTSIREQKREDSAEDMAGGSLRHAATCIHATRPFLLRLRFRENQLHRFQRVTVSNEMKQVADGGVRANDGGLECVLSSDWSGSENGG
ncbi:hypothetical protein PHMEG_00023995 [Phytophthora megakarya]|uniref:Uncharacterized protein n=1 Tax=Phytophthora megakarya TaxID=4795 RepID=A0A225VGQ0_9STRA|nr:hypothetical protein PHMEG_00023995 [Phytophthora megakarya]